MLPAPPLPAWLERMLPFRRYRVRVREWAMHVMEAGPSDGLPVVLFHGNPAWGFLWRKVVAELGSLAPSHRLRLIMPDLIGLGLSDHPGELATHTLDFHARQMGALVDELRLKSFVFVGHDWGGPIGGAVCADRPERVAGAVVLNTALGPPHAGFRPTEFHRFSHLPIVSDVVFRLGLFPARGMGLAQADRKSITGVVARAYRWPLRDRFTNVAPLALARMVPNSLEHPSVERLRQVEAWAKGFKGPAELVWGVKDPLLGRLLKRTKALLPHAKVTATDAGHFLQEEVPTEIAQAILRVGETVR